MTEKVDPKEYEAAWDSVLDCVDGMKEEFSWSKDVIAKMLRKLAEKVENEKGKKNRLLLFHQFNDLALLENASSQISKKTSP